MNSEIKKKRIEQILENGAQLNHIEPSPFLFRKIMTKMETREEKSISLQYWFIGCAVILLIVLNSFVLISENNLFSTTELQSVALDYPIISDENLYTLNENLWTD